MPRMRAASTSANVARIKFRHADGATVTIVPAGHIDYTASFFRSH
jgi:hypothetical protein